MQKFHQEWTWFSMSDSLRWEENLSCPGAAVWKICWVRHHGSAQYEMWCPLSTGSLVCTALKCPCWEGWFFIRCCGNQLGCIWFRWTFNLCRKSYVSCCTLKQSGVHFVLFLCSLSVGIFVDDNDHTCLSLCPSSMSICMWDLHKAYHSYL